MLGKNIFTVQHPPEACPDRRIPGYRFVRHDGGGKIMPKNPEIKSSEVPVRCHRLGPQNLTMRNAGPQP